MRILLLDNYDSFTWNLHHLLEPMATVDVVRNDALTVNEAARYDAILLSPGPGLPAEAGIMPALLDALMPTHPILGICLGMQAIVQACGGQLYNQPQVMHGVAVECRPEPPLDPLFAGMDKPFEVGLYHSWATEPTTLPATLRTTARSATGVIMAVRHESHPAHGLQFHPESVMTEVGIKIIRNWIDVVSRSITPDRI